MGIAIAVQGGLGFGSGLGVGLHPRIKHQSINLKIQNKFKTAETHQRPRKHVISFMAPEILCGYLWNLLNI